MWAAGISMYMLMFGGRHPFLTSSNSLDEQMLLQGRLDFREEKQNVVGGFFGGLLNGQQSSSQRFSDMARRICSRMVEPKAEARISAQDAINDRWLVQVQRRTSEVARNVSRQSQHSAPSNGGYPQQVQATVDPNAQVLQQQMEREAWEKDRRIKSLEKKVNGLQDALQQQSSVPQPPAPVAQPPAAANKVDASRKTGILTPGLRCRYQSSSYGWMTGTVQSMNDDGTYNLDIRQHASPQNIAPPDRPEAENDIWPNGTTVFYQSSTYQQSRNGLPAAITGYNAADGTYNLDIRDHAAIDRIRARIGEHMLGQQENQAGMRTEKTQQGSDVESSSALPPVPVQAYPSRSSASSQMRLADGSKCMLEQHGQLTIAVVEGFNQSEGCYNLMVDFGNVRRSMTVRSEFIRAPRNAADAWPNGTQVMYESASMSTWVPGVIISFNVANGTYNLDVRDGAPPERVRPR